MWDHGHVEKPKARFILRFVGVTVFEGARGGGRSLSVSAGSIRPAPGERLTKSAALEFLRGRGIDVGRSNNCTFATLSPGGEYFWANPRTAMLDRDWRLVLSDYRKFELVVLFVPAGTLRTRADDPRGLLCRNDKPDLVDLRVSADTLRDIPSGTDLSRFVVARVGC